ncbi:TIGR00341 family protein [Aquibacillus sp. 3ASR75-11]|uniref:TIGR00341 family protein n=1 Tax=Terrihalobacillus insolitus TaxID=2950438 RepID=A0A9X3WWL8_9BACI|nr:TIGR00341 family protein [Terrihalobacillus insolitus]MDC3413574.1 TIGR00341 family protein [Terrihalobacillus insolitus]MDC3424669.1 TIGR00341 family protein [Terrihalobacillus insolitus]
MNFQLIEVYVPKDSLDSFHKKLSDFTVVSHWTSNESEKYSLLRILVRTEYSEQILDFLQREAKYNANLRALLFSLQTYIPQQNDDKKKKPESKNEVDEITRASRQELYSAVQSSSGITWGFTWFILLAAIVATSGIIKDNQLIVISAMVISPLLGPFTAAGFASVLGDYPLIRQSVLTFLYGLTIAVCIAAVTGFFFPLPMDSQGFLANTEIDYIDILIAMASGAAGALSFVKRSSEALFGVSVMISVATLPPAVVFGLFIGAARWAEAITPLLLVSVNISSILLSTILVFWLSGIKPINWKEIQTANTSRTYSLFFIVFFVTLLAVLIYVINF